MNGNDHNEKSVGKLVGMKTNMPSTRPKLCHIDHIKRVCLLCFGKTKRMLPLTDDLRQIIDTNFVCGINATDDRLPTSICKTCYTLYVLELSAGWAASLLCLHKNVNIRLINK